MPSRPPNVPPRLARGLVLAGSAVVVAHLFVVLMNALAAPSGPWPTHNGPNNADPPRFAFRVHEETNRTYLRALKMTHNYHFASNRLDLPGVEIEARLKDAGGNVTATLRFPNPDANAWARHHQTLLARNLGDDVVVPNPQGEAVPAPNQTIRTITIWDGGRGNEMVLRAVPEHLVPRDRPVFRPSEWSLVLARSYARHLAREHGAASVEIVRRSRDAIPPSALPEPAPEFFETMIANFGEFKP